MADQHNANIPAVGNTIAGDIPDIKENLEYHKDVFENFCTTWSNTVATGIYPNKFADTTATPIVLQKKVLEIGDWNMDSTQTVTIAHGLTFGNIRSINTLIRNDANDTYSTLEGGVSSTASGFAYADGTNINLTRIPAGSYDAATYDSTSFNRGWVIVEYVAS